MSVNSSDLPKLAFADILAEAKPAEHSVRLCLRGDLVAQVEDLDRQLKKVQAREVDSLAGTGARPIAEAMEALVDEMDQHSVTFLLRALPRRQYQALTKAHPPRKDDDGKILPEDAGFEINAGTFWFSLTRACLVEPQMSDEQYARLVDDILSDRQFEQLATAAFNVCRGFVDIPFSLAASMTRISGGASNAPNGSVSPSVASTAGSPPLSTSTTSTTG